MLDIVKIDSVLKELALNGRYRFNAHQVAYLSGEVDINAVYEYLITKEPYVLFRRFEVQCPENFDATGSYTSEEDIPNDWIECRICGCEFIPDRDLIQVVFYFTEMYQNSVKREFDNKKKLIHPLNRAC